MMKKTYYACALVFGLIVGQSAHAETWDAGISEKVEVQHPDTPDTTTGGVWDAGIAEQVNVKNPDTPDTTQGGVWDGGMTEHVKVKYPDLPQ
ncbi:hypothetical protein [Acetobacter ghanensis]|nr:hypothetical protein [Acetobacter ghanensis]